VPEQLLDRLRDFDSPNISNAIELLAVRDRTEGFASLELRCLFPELKPMVGYAVTCTADSTSPGEPRPSQLNHLLDAIAAQQNPVVVVVQNCGPDRLRTCYIGDMAALFFDRLGAVGAVTDGGIRDLSGIKVRVPGFQVFSPGAVVSHGNSAITDVGIPVTVAGLLIKPGDLLHGDESGLLSVPNDLLAPIVEKAEQVRKTEQEWVDYVRCSSFNLDELKRRFIH
jgi:4-hydroxy-4-methyl-2-oxoglutarate aldolase